MVDKNFNAFPAIFNMMGATNPSVPVQEQYRILCQAMREAGEGHVHISAYMSHIDMFVEGQKKTIIKYILMPLLSERAELIAKSKSPSSPEHCNIVFVWSIDSLAMLSRKHMAHMEYLIPNIRPMSLYRLISKILMSVGIEHEDQIEAGRVTNISDVLNDKQVNMDATASKYLALKKLYEEVSGGMKKKEEIISHELLEKFDMVGEEHELCQTATKVQEIYNQRWKCVKKCLDLVNRRSAKSKDKKYTNVVMTNEGVADAAGELMVSGLSSSINIDQIYSTLNSSEEDVWRRIQKRFGKNCVFIYVNTPPQNQYRYPLEGDVVFWADNANESITILYETQRKKLLK